MTPCTRCRQPHGAATKMCGDCLDIERQRDRDRREQRYDAGQCGQCGEAPESGSGYCEACKRYFRDWFSKSANRRRNRVDQKKLRVRWKKWGLCVRCGQRPPEDGRVTCFVCLEYAREYREARRDELCRV